MAITYSRFHDELRRLIDSVSHDPDPATRLSNIQQLYKDSLTMLLDARNEAAYELRSRYNSADASTLVGVERKYIDYWAKTWRIKKMLPHLKQKARQDLSHAVDLTDRQRASRPHDPAGTSHPTT